MELELVSIIAVEAEPIHITGGKSKEKAIEILQRAIELIQKDEVSHETVEEE